MIRKLLQAYRARREKRISARRQAGYSWAAGELLKNGDVEAVEQWLDLAACFNDVDSFDNGAHMAIADWTRLNRERFA